MLDIVSSCNPVQYQGKVIMQTWENGKDPNLEPNYGLQKNFLWVFPLLVVRNKLEKMVKHLISGLILAQLCGFYPYWMLDIVASYPHL